MLEHIQTRGTVRNRSISLLLSTLRTTDTLQFLWKPAGIIYFSYCTKGIYLLCKLCTEIDFGHIVLLNVHMYANSFLLILSSLMSYITFGLNFTEPVYQRCSILKVYRIFVFEKIKPRREDEDTETKYKYYLYLYLMFLVKRP